MTPFKCLLGIENSKLFVHFFRITKLYLVCASFVVNFNAVKISSDNKVNTVRSVAGEKNQFSLL